MTDWGEPRRWHESELPEDARVILESAAGDDPSRERLATVESRLAAALGWPIAADGTPDGGSSGSSSSTGASAGSTGAGTTIASTTAMKVIVGAIAVAGVVGLGAWLATERAEVPRGTQPEHAAAATRETERAREPVPDPEPTVAPPPTQAPREDQPPVRPPRTPRAVPSEQPPEDPPAAHPTISTLEQELRLVDAARAALDHAPDRALALADAHRTSFPHGTLTPERELITIEALLALDRIAEATARAATLRRDHPASPAAHRAQRLITDRAQPQ